MRQKLSVVLSLMLALVLVLSACGSSNNNGGSAAPNTWPGASPSVGTPKVEVTLAGWGSSPEEEALLKQVLVEFRIQKSGC